MYWTHVNVPFIEISYFCGTEYWKCWAIVFLDNTPLSMPNISIGSTTSIEKDQLNLITNLQ